MIIEKKKIILTVICFMFFMFFVVYFLIQHSYYSISYTNETSDIKLSYVNSDGAEKPAKSLLGLTMVPRNTATIIAQSNNTETRVLTHNKLPLGVNSTTITLKPQHEVIKIGKDGLGCDGRSTGEKVFSYSCGSGTNTILTYGNKKIGQYDNNILSTSLSENRLVTKSYNGGIIALQDSRDGVYVEYYNIDTETVSRERLSFADSDTLNLYTEKSGDNFIIVDNTNHEVLFYNSFGSTSKKLSFSKDIIYTSCELDKALLYCVTTHSIEHTHEEEEDEPHIANEDLLIDDAQLVSYNTKTKEQNYIKLPTLAKDLCVSPTGIYTLDSRDILSYIPKNTKDIHIIDNDVVSLFCAGDMSFYSTDSSVYKITDSGANLLFRENHLVISSLYADNEKVLMSTLINPERDIFHTYEIGSKPITGKHVESILPYSSRESLPIFEMDYDDKNIYIKPSVSVISDKALGITIVDQESLAQAKESIENRLKRDGLLRSHKLIYYFN